MMYFCSLDLFHHIKEPTITKRDHLQDMMVYQINALIQM